MYHPAAAESSPPTFSFGGNGRKFQRFCISSAMRAYLFCLLITLFPATTRAEIAYQQIRPGISTGAEYRAGERSKPAVLLLHGFLQTRDFPTVATLARSLNEAGYSVLSPTLSLNIPNRAQSLACEAVHNHNLGDDIAEVARWVGWLKSRGHRSIVLIGHSFGAFQLLAYLTADPDAAIKRYIGISLLEPHISPASRATLIAQLEHHLKTDPRALVAMRLSYCRKYLSTPEALLSYLRWDQPRILSVLKSPPVPVSLIMGDADDLLGSGWIKALKHVQTPMVIVKGANHFMDGEYEFELLDPTLKFLDMLNRP